MIRKYAGHKVFAFAIWQKGLPCQRISRQGLLQSTDVDQVERIQEDLDDMIQFFTSVGNQVQERRKTEEYAEASWVNYLALAAHDHDWSSWLHRARI